MRARRQQSLDAEAPPDWMLGPGRTIPAGHDAALLEWLGSRGLLARGEPPFAPGLIDPINDLLLAPIHHPDETWEEFAARLAGIERGGVIRPALTEPAATDPH